MKTSRTFAAAAIAALVAAGPIMGAFAARAADPAKPAAEAQTTGKLDAVTRAYDASKQAAVIRTADDAFKGMREIRAARIAIFNGDTDSAVNFAHDARTFLGAAEAMMADYEVKTVKTAAEGDGYMPFDGSISLSEGYVATPEKQTILQEANELLRTGEHHSAIEKLKLADIDVTTSVAMIPVKKSISHVETAEKLMKEGRWYQANLALKAVEDSVLVESFDINSAPAQGAM